ncbi:phenylalanine--tRNA ligase subunit beta [Kaistia dalseonensis]|uniref:Phenylalanine--tRNA ligase beta subunit n=1 Tax=Kaistia dalseonensis TaxID=410840 RepID=A0ABU0H5K2_9HYPH|nr:phenylalanine--tRNA ligase subunit beta [Kaistia dalseonensis]MCX5495002.1 phenylalanine--tRNA ligase subunit beta [Kaistia dalseonensis]MDQ0437583.1 phenylalanyl-tRNA synthetase beta chain [Kaistia dalseonensis]
MKFTLSWLKEHLDTSASLDAITDGLTRVGLEVEGVEDKAKTLGAFTIAYVVSAVQHPNADRLRVCMVDTGSGDPVQVVCGAPNARAGMKSVFSPPGTYIPGKDITLSVGTIRGVESHGMLCSAAELELSNDHDGIIELPADAPVGVRYADWAGLADPVIDIAITPNRSDCLGVYGVARDLAAAGLGTLKDGAVAPVPGQGPVSTGVTLEFGDTPSLCPAFGLRLVRGVKNGPSPEWLQAKLRAIGLRPINALVDITNYLTFDRGRPLHVFDAAKMQGGLTVRRARDGETLMALDGKTYTLDSSMCVIADDNGVESLAGIMGGEASGCSEATVDVLIESALWEPLNIAQTGRKLGINTDARYRFERGVDPAFMVPGLDLATRLVLELCGGTPSDILVAGDIPEPRLSIAFPISEVKRLVGIDPSEDEIRRVLTALGFTVSGHAPSLTVGVPSWRPDIDGKADLVEEVMRILGVDRVPSTPLPKSEHAGKPAISLGQLRTRRAKRALATRGLVEAVTWSFVAKAVAEAFGGGAPALALANPISTDMTDMRPSLLPGLVLAAQRNADRGISDLALFEVGQIFRGTKPNEQFTAATGVRRNTANVNGSGRHWQSKAPPVSVFDAKADALALLDALGAPVEKFQIIAGGPAWFHPGRSGTIQLGPQNVIGWFGEFHPATLEALDVEGPLVGFELILEAIPAPRARPTRTKPPLDLLPFQPVTRDFAFVVDRSVEVAKIIKAAQSADKVLISTVSVFDLFEGAALGADKKSVAIEVTLRPTQKTLTDGEIEAVAAKIVAQVSKATGAVLRT